MKYFLFLVLFGVLAFVGYRGWQLHFAKEANAYESMMREFQAGDVTQGSTYFAEEISDEARVKIARFQPAIPRQASVTNTSWSMGTRAISEDGKQARLRMIYSCKYIEPGQPGTSRLTQSHTVHLVLEKGEWKVLDVEFGEPALMPAS